jgi:hypothetical protein
LQVAAGIGDVLRGGDQVLRGLDGGLPAGAVGAGAGAGTVWTASVTAMRSAW